MKIGQVIVRNFQSYREMSFDYEDLGLALISGDTGAGKSTFLDAIAWTLFGVTGKDSAADDVRAWDADGPTTGVSYVGTPTGAITVYRTRAPGKNDLYWQEASGEYQTRGKDLTDTQRLLEKRLGVTAELFLTGSYLTQFSKADSFFIAKAKDRRDVLEQIADQEFAISLGEKASEARKVAKKEQEVLGLQLAKASGSLEMAERAVRTAESDGATWDTAQAEKLRHLRQKLESFDEDKAHRVAALKQKSLAWNEARELKFGAICDWLSDLPPTYPDRDYKDALAELDSEIASLRSQKCAECGGPYAGAQMERLRVDRDDLFKVRQENLTRFAERESQDRALDELRAAVDPHLSGLQQAQDQTNPYGAQLEAAGAEVNPYHKRQAEASAAAQNLTAAVHELQDALLEKETLVSRLTWLYDKSFELRGLLMTRVVAQIESSTNAYLERFFDAALRVQFTLQDSDKLEVEISNNGYPASFKSLSGGERCMLKLAFSLSLMKAAQAKAGVDFGMILLDEAFNGLSDGLKVKAFGLLEQLSEEYPTVLVIDHSPALKAQFSKVFTVSKASGNSEVHEQTN